jgi:hypothetical protein
MAEYIKKQKLLNDTRIYKDDNGVVRTRKFFFRNYIESLPIADVVEQEKIDEAIDETYKIRNEVLQANGCYEPNDVIDIIDQITKLFEEI